MSVVCRAFGALLLFIGSASAQSGGSRATLTGHWLVRYEHEKRSHLSEAQIVIDTARLTLRQRGDSVSGEWQSIVSSNDAPDRPRTLRGVVRLDNIRLEVDL